MKFLFGKSSGKTWGNSCSGLLLLYYQHIQMKILKIFSAAHHLIFSSKSSQYTHTCDVILRRKIEPNLFLAQSFLVCCICQCYRVFSVARIVNKALRSVFGVFRGWAEKDFSFHTTRLPVVSEKASFEGLFSSCSSRKGDLLLVNHRSLNFPNSPITPKCNIVKAKQGVVTQRSSEVWIVL